jgi:pimeloyl-ACP methyl ester carboxylesterase
VELTWWSRGEVRLPVVSVGDEAATPVLLLPGLTDGLAPLTDPDARAQMASPPPALAGDLRVHVVSHRFPAGPDVTTRMLAADAAALLEDLVDRPVILVGHSMGAMVAQHLAADRPDLIERMVLSCTVGRADDGFRRRLAEWETLVRARRWEAFYTAAIDRSYTGSAWLARRVAQRVLPTRSPSDELRTRHLALSAACASHDALDRLADVDVPTLVLAGEQDEVTAPHHARELAEALPDATVEIWAGLGHGLPEQAAGRFGRRLLRFLEVTA